jgi:hypothetical protein
MHHKAPDVALENDQGGFSFASSIISFSLIFLIVRQAFSLPIKG